MTIEELKDIIETGEEMDDNDLRLAFRVVYEREPDAQDERDGLYSLIVAGLD